jgi:hypothetical protein
MPPHPQQQPTVTSKHYLQMIVEHFNKARLRATHDAKLGQATGRAASGQA